MQRMPVPKRKLRKVNVYLTENTSSSTVGTREFVTKTVVHRSKLYDTDIRLKKDPVKEKERRFIFQISQNNLKN